MELLMRIPTTRESTIIKKKKKMTTERRSSDLILRLGYVPSIQYMSEVLYTFSRGHYDSGLSAVRLCRLIPLTYSSEL